MSRSWNVKQSVMGKRNCSKKQFRVPADVTTGPSWISASARSLAGRASLGLVARHSPPEPRSRCNDCFS
jgi:hypothetical protein